MLISNDIFAAFLKCETKAHLYSSGHIGAHSEFTDWREHLQKEFSKRSRERLSVNVPAEKWLVGTPPLLTLKERRYRVIIDYEAAAGNIRSHIHALIQIAGRSKTNYPYSPIRFVTHEKVTTIDKLLLAFDALALSESWHETPKTGKIMYGRRHRMATIALAGLLKDVKRILGCIATQQKKATSPPLILNKHCPECEFQSRCRPLAVEKDDLSLLSHFSGKERKRQNDNGIFTVTQLSYAFRPRRRSGSTVIKFQHALRALAIRKKQIHVVGTPALTTFGTSVYLDVEGDSDRDFYYLIGLRICSSGSCVHHSFWANDVSEESDIWASCLNTLSSIDAPRLIHYGSYETRFLTQMKARYPDHNPTLSEQLISSALNLLSIVYAQIYFPTYSNSLKEVAHYLGFHWSENSASGLSALLWRSQWETFHSPDLKQKLLTYNAEDCEAAEKVADALCTICQPNLTQETPRADVVPVDSLQREYPQHFGLVEFRLPEFKQINEAAYWNYQRDKVYVQSNRHLKRLKRNNPEACSTVPINKTVTVDEERPSSCRRCNGTLIYKTGWFKQIVYDLKFSTAGVKRWVVRYSFPRYICWQCKASFYKYSHKYKYGAGLCAFVLYHVVEMLTAQNALVASLRQLFGLPLSRGAIQNVKINLAKRYQPTYQDILDRIVTGKLVHADETQVEIDGSVRYVWVFTNLEDVAFVYSDTREASTAQELLRKFNGVLVSDFYAGYDSIDCEQQKCLIHLIRDINDDLSKEPFNEEMKELAQEFARLVRPMVESVDRFGLKVRHLRKHKSSVDRFYGRLTKRHYQSEIVAGYRKRFEKNKDKLFTFLDHDGVPWNNNNAEHAIKAFARLRNNIGGKSTVKGIRDYLVLLSISETCKYRGVNFLTFLRSGEKDVAAFAATRTRSIQH
jgi:predicted RecB family nuclease